MPRPPLLPVAPGSIAANARDFARAWNANAAGTGVPQLSESDVTAVDNGPEATTFIAVLSDRTGLVGVMRNDDQSLAEALLVWIPGGDEAASNQRFRDAFDVLVRTADPELGDEERAALAEALGLSASAPPFPADQQATAEAGPSRYTRFTRDTDVAANTVIVSLTAAG